MRSTTISFGSAICLLILIAGCDTEVTVPPEQFQPRWHFLAAGDPIVGRQVFTDLKCNTCHRVSGNELNGATIMAPELGSMVAGQSADAIASSIIAPSHSVSAKGGLWRYEKPAEMPDYSKVMTVRQLMDLVAYMRAPRN
jgi:cytochrome c2